MTEQEILEKAMYNSYNVITHKCSIQEVEEEGLPFFIHFPDRDIDKASIKIMVMYFIMQEEYEKCKELSDVYELLFQEEMPSLLCECKVPQYEMIDEETIECKKCKAKIL